MIVIVIVNVIVRILFRHPLGIILHEGLALLFATLAVSLVIDPDRSLLTQLPVSRHNLVLQMEIGIVV